MRAGDLPARFAELVRAAGGDLAALPPELAWRMFVDLAREPVDGVADTFDLLVFESSDPSRAFGVDLVRRFAIYEHDDYTGSEVFSCTLTYDPARAPQGVERALVQKTRDELASFVAEVEATAAYRMLIGAGPTAVALHVGAG